MRPIDADAAMSLIKIELEKFKGNTKHEASMRGGIRKAVRCIEYTKTLDVAPVVHGRWLRIGTGETYCSVCSEFLPTVDYTQGGYDDYWDCRVEIERTPYCPRCGAKMDEEGQK